MKFIGYLFALIAVFFWSFNNIIAKEHATDLTPIEFAAGRWLVAALILLPFTAKELWKNRAYFKKRLLWIFSLGLSGIVLDNTLIYLAAETASATNIGILSILAPIFLALLSFFFLHKPITRKQIIGMLVAVFGVLIVITKGDLTDITRMKIAVGDFWVIANAAFFALYSFLQFSKPKNISQTALLSITVWAGVIVLLPLLFLYTPLPVLRKLTLVDYSLFIYLGIFNSVLAYLFWNSALAKIGAVQTGIIYYLLPIFTMIEAAFVLKSEIHLNQIIGGFIVICGILLVTFGQKQKETRTVKKNA